MPDPRFDPAFQRGYSGPAPELVTRPQATPAPRTVPDVAVPPIAGVPDAHPASGPAEPTAAASAAASADLLPEEPWQPPRRNPFAIALLVGGLVMLALGGAMIWSSAALQNRTYDQSTFDTASQALSITSYLLPPALLLGGILGLLAWLILNALGSSPGRDLRR